MYKGKWYAEIFESEQFVGIKTLEIKEFNTKEEQQSFINEYNMTHLDFDLPTPQIYTMAREANYYVVLDYLRSILK